MTIWNKLVTALRGAAHEAGEAVTVITPTAGGFGKAKG